MQVPIDAFEGNRMKKVYVMTYVLLELPENPMDEICLLRARSLIFLLIRCLLFSDGLGSKVNLRYLPFLEDLKRPVPLSWGSRVLTYRYRSLCTASSGLAREIHVLVQLWAWERLPILRPQYDIEIQSKLLDMAPYRA